MPGSVSLPQILKAHQASAMENTHTCLPCKVLKYYPATQTVDIQILVKRPGKDEEGEIVYEELPAYPNVQVAFHRAGPFTIYLPVAAGHYGHAVFCDMATGEVQSSGQLSEPQDTSRHAGGYCIFIPGGYPDPEALVDCPVDEGYVGVDDDDAQVRFKAGEIRLGNSATQYVALASLVTAQLNALKSAIAAAPIVPLDGGAAFKTSLVAALASWPTAVAATIVKAK